MDIRYEQDRFVAYSSTGEVLGSSKNRDYLRNKVRNMVSCTPAVFTPAAEQFSINDRFMFTEQLVSMVANGSTASCVITGEGGLGKTYSVLKALNAAGLTDISEYAVDEVVPARKTYRVIKGFSTAKGLYKILYENRNSVVVFDDIDSLLKDPDAVNLLKGALDSYDKRVITWNTNTTDEDLPRSFQFNGGVIFISNMKLIKIDQAIRSRSMVVDLAMSMSEKIERMETIMVSEEFMPSVSSDMKKDALSLIDQCKDSAREISLRTLINTIKIRCSGNNNWSALARYALIA